MLRVLDLFSGIGGFSLGLERAGMRTVAFCEIEPYCRAVLRKHWPTIPCYDDIRTLTAGRLAADGIAVDAICGGFPCQPYSQSAQNIGTRLGNADDRALWPEYRRLIEELRPTWVIGENVVGLVELALDGVLADLETLGYSARAFDIPAGSVGAFHERRRLWVVANSYGIGLESKGKIGDVTEVVERKKDGTPNASAILDCMELKPFTNPWRFGGTDGLSDWMDRLRAIGNAVVPQIPEIIGRAILEAEELKP